MTSGDNYITIEMFNGGIQEIKSEMNQRFDKLENEIKEIKQEIRLNKNDTEHLQTSIYWGFAIIGVVIALVGFVVSVLAILPHFSFERTERSEDLSSRNIRDIRALIREEFNFMRNAELRNN